MMAKEDEAGRGVIGRSKGGSRGTEVGLVYNSSCSEVRNGDCIEYQWVHLIRDVGPWPMAQMLSLFS